MSWPVSMSILVDSDRAPRKRVPAIGFGDFHAIHPKVSMLFDDDVFIALRKRAIKEETSFAEQVRRTLRKGLGS
jgi:hypothetical protein